MKNLPNEEWRDIIGYEGIYQVSSLGRIKRLPRHQTYKGGANYFYDEMEIKTVVNKRNGYSYVGLSKNRKQYGNRVQRLVAKAFIDNPNNLPEVNHLNYNKQDNSVSNLEWCDRYRQNQHSAKKPGRKWQKHRLGKTGNQNPASLPVIGISISTGEEVRFESQHLAANNLGLQQTKISSCCHGKRNSHGGYKWKFMMLQE